MPLTELPLSVLFLLFLLLFVLVGLYPAWKRGAAKLRRLLKDLEKSQLAESGIFKPAEAPRSAERKLIGKLNSYEVLVFSHLAPRAAKGLSSKRLSADLHLERKNIRQALKSLHDRGLIRVAVTRFFGVRFFLSEQGRVYAIDQDFIPQIPLSRGRR